MTVAIGPKFGHAAKTNRTLAAKRGAANLIAQVQISAISEVGNAENQNRSARSAQGPGHRVVVGPLRVLIVEDDLTIGPLLAEVLDELGHIVCAVETDTLSAVAAARRYRPDLIIVDVRLGTASGISAVREIIREGFVPHVFVTGDALRSLPLGPEAVLVQKPYRPSDLATAIATAIARGSTLEASG